MKWSFLRQVFSWIMAIPLVYLCSGCGRPHFNVHLIVPKDFRGAFIIYVNQGNGISIVKKDGFVECIIPPSGILRIKENPFYNYSIIALYDDGIKIPIGSDLPSNSADVVAFWDGGARPNMVYDFIGTKDEHLVFKKQVAAAKVEPGKVMQTKARE